MKLIFKKSLIFVIIFTIIPSVLYAKRVKQSQLATLHFNIIHNVNQKYQAVIVGEAAEKVYYDLSKIYDYDISRVMKIKLVETNYNIKSVSDTKRNNSFELFLSGDIGQIISDLGAGIEALIINDSRLRKISLEPVKPIASVKPKKFDASSFEDKKNLLKVLVSKDAEYIAIISPDDGQITDKFRFRLRGIRNPIISGDGKTIVFTASSGCYSNLWVYCVEEKSLRPLTDDEFTIRNFYFADDYKTVYFQSNINQEGNIFSLDFNEHHIGVLHTPDVPE